MGSRALASRGVCGSVALAAGLCFSFPLLFGQFAAPVRVSAQDAPAAEVTKRKVKTRVAPEYSTLARQMRASGKVKIEVTIAADGHITSTRTVGGNPVLVASCLEALKKWRFEAAPKETTEIIEFDFNGE